MTPHPSFSMFYIRRNILFIPDKVILHFSFYFLLTKELLDLENVLYLVIDLAELTELYIQNFL